VGIFGCCLGGPGSLVHQFQSSFPGTDPILDRASCSHEATKPKLAISGPPRETNRRIRNAPRMGKAIWESGLRVRTGATQNESGTRRQADRCRESQSPVSDAASRSTAGAAVLCRGPDVSLMYPRCCASQTAEWWVLGACVRACVRASCPKVGVWSTASLPAANRTSAWHHNTQQTYIICERKLTTSGRRRVSCFLKLG
jgi:hypothetical protein